MIYFYIYIYIYTCNMYIHFFDVTWILIFRKHGHGECCLSLLQHNQVLNPTCILCDIFAELGWHLSRLKHKWGFPDPQSSSILIGFPTINHPFSGTPMAMEPPISAEAGFLWPWPGPWPNGCHTSHHGLPCDSGHDLAAMCATGDGSEMPQDPRLIPDQYHKPRTEGLESPNCKLRQFKSFLSMGIRFNFELWPLPHIPSGTWWRPKAIRKIGRIQNSFARKTETPKIPWCIIPSLFNSTSSIEVLCYI